MTNDDTPSTPRFDFSHYSLETLAVRAGQLRTEEGAHSEPIFMTSSFVFPSAQAAAERFSGETPGNIYSRFTNPTVQSFEQRLAAMEGGERAIATASGMSAIFATCVALLEAGDEVVCSRAVFGTTHVLFDKYLRKMGVTTHWVPLTDFSAWQAAITAKTKLLFLESPSNPLSEIADIRALASLAQQSGAWLVVDNCFCTPVLQRPLSLGADIVIHSATKLLDGQGRSVGGAVVGGAALMEQVYGVLRTCGPAMSPFNAWIALKGLETLSIRVKAQSESALQLALWLSQQPQVVKVHYAGLPDHPHHQLAQSQQSAFGSVLSFEVPGGRAQAWELIDQCQMISISANLGDVKTIITHPATTTHGRLSPEMKTSAGISEGLVRLSVGLEALEDLKQELAPLTRP